MVSMWGLMMALPWCSIQIEYFINKIQYSKTAMYTSSLCCLLKSLLVGCELNYCCCHQRCCHHHWSVTMLFLLKDSLSLTAIPVMSILLFKDNRAWFQSEICCRKTYLTNNNLTYWLLSSNLLHSSTLAHFCTLSGLILLQHIDCMITITMMMMTTTTVGYN